MKRRERLKKPRRFDPPSPFSWMIGALFLLTLALAQISFSESLLHTSYRLRQDKFLLPSVPRCTPSVPCCSGSLLRSSSYRQSRTHHDEDEKDSTWTLQQDWSLLDAIPKFTVTTETETRTFWSQLWSATPILMSSKQGPDELYRRMVLLQEQENKEETKSTLEENEKGLEGQESELNNTANTTSLLSPTAVASSETKRSPRHTLPAFGKSPPLLQNWKIDFDEHGRGGNRVSGQVDDGRTIWFSYHVIGRLKGDPLVDACTPSLILLVPGGYLEAVGGRIYELGDCFVASPPSSTPSLSPSSPLWLDEVLEDSHRAYVNPIGRGDGYRKNDGGLVGWDGWVDTGTATMSALLATTVLSLSIGYGAGLSIIHDNALHQQELQQQHHQQHRPIPAASALVSVPSVQSQSLPQSSSSMQPSQDELRARAQYRVLREQRLLDQITQKLQQDKEFLQEMDGGTSSTSKPAITSTIDNLFP